MAASLQVEAFARSVGADQDANGFLIERRIESDFDAVALLQAGLARENANAASRRPFPSAFLKIVKANSGSMLVDVVRDKKDHEVIWHCLFAINQPSRYCIEICNGTQSAEDCPSIGFTSQST